MPPLYNAAGLDYNGPFYSDTIPREVRLERRAMVTHYVPHTFAEYPVGSIRRGLCRICGFPGGDAACNPSLSDQYRAARAESRRAHPETAL